MMHRNEPQCLRMQHTGNSFREQIISLLEVCVHFTQQSVPSSPPPSCFEGNRVCYCTICSLTDRCRVSIIPPSMEFSASWKFHQGNLGGFETNQTLTAYFTSIYEHLLEMPAIVLSRPQILRFIWFGTSSRNRSMPIMHLFTTCRLELI